MDLPVRLQTEPGSEPVVSVDGAWGAPGLNLSHWPGNETPAELKHELSTGVALNFARLPAERRRALAAGCVAIANNHLDTDGVCATLALVRPDLALAREERLLAAAAAGDFFRVPSEEAFVVDRIVSGLADPERSPLRARLADLSDPERHELAYREGLARLPELLDGRVEPYAALWRAPLAALRADLADLARAQRDDLVHLELTIWTSPPGEASSRSGARAFDPGRHALFGSTRADRALVVGPRADGTTYRLIVNTSSWFDLPGVEPLPRPDLEALAARLEGLEAERGKLPFRWRAQPVTNAAPELWFGEPSSERFAEHSPALRPSSLPPELVRREVIEALRAVWVFPE